jgi:rod shape-determining protein MreD
VNPLRGGWVILLSIAVAMMLAVAHLPEGLPQWLGYLRPAWVLLVVFFWVMSLPDRLGMITAWLVGLILDVIRGDPLGVNGFCLAALTYITWSLYERLRMYSVIQQGGVVFLLVLGTEIFRGVVDLATRDAALDWRIMLPALVSMLVWPFVFLFMQRVQRQFAVD